MEEEVSRVWKSIKVKAEEGERVCTPIKRVNKDLVEAAMEGE